MYNTITYIEDIITPYLLSTQSLGGSVGMTLTWGVISHVSSISCQRYDNISVVVKLYVAAKPRPNVNNVLRRYCDESKVAARISGCWCIGVFKTAYQ